MHVRCIHCKGSELGRLPKFFMPSELHSIVRRCPSRCFVSGSPGLIVPRIFSSSFCSSQKHFVSMCLMALHPPRTINPHAVAAPVQIRTRDSWPSSRIVLAKPTAPNAQRTMLQWRHHLLRRRPRGQRCVVRCVGRLQMWSVVSWGIQRRLRRRSRRSSRCSLFVLYRDVPHGTWHVEQEPPARRLCPFLSSLRLLSPVIVRS